MEYVVTRVYRIDGVHQVLSELFRKWFGLDPISCETCEILRMQLAESNAERKDLLHRLLEKDKSEPPPSVIEEHTPIQPQFIPWRVKQQMLEAEDRQRAKLMRNKAEEIQELEKELGINHGDAPAVGE